MVLAQVHLGAQGRVCVCAGSPTNVRQVGVGAGVRDQLTRGVSRYAGGQLCHSQVTCTHSRACLQTRVPLAHAAVTAYTRAPGGCKAPSTPIKICTVCRGLKVCREGRLPPCARPHLVALGPLLRLHAQTHVVVPGACDEDTKGLDYIRYMARLALRLASTGARCMEARR